MGDAFRVFVLLVLEYCSAVWCSASDTHLKLLDRGVSVASFFTGGVFECDLAHHRSVAVLSMLYKIRCNPMNPLYDALHEPYVPVCYTRCCDRTWVHLCSSSLKNSQYLITFISLSVSLWNDLCDPVFDGVGLTGFKSRANAFLLA